MNDLLQRQFGSAVALARNASSQNISHDFLGTFVRVAKQEPYKIQEVIDILMDHINTHPSNIAASLYCLIKLADVSDTMKKMVKDKVGDEFIEFYSEDENQEIANNAIILGKVIEGTPLTEFQSGAELPADNQTSNIYNLSNSNLAINSPNAIQTIKVDELDNDILAKLVELQQAIDNKNTAAIKKVFTYIADKSVDVAIALLTQGVRL